MYLASHDDLTGLPNRAHLVAMVSAVKSAKPKNAYLLYLDLDGFKSVNDTLGHVAGDELLRLMAQRIRRELQPGHVAGRIGGDEFLVLLLDIDPREAEAIAGRLIAVAMDPFSIGVPPFR